MRLSGPVLLAVAMSSAFLHHVYVTALGALRVRRGGGSSTQRIASADHSGELPHGPAFQGRTVTPRWPKYVSVRNREVQPFVIEGKVKSQLLSRFRKYLRSMDKIRRNVLLCSELTTEEKLSISQAFHDYSWIKGRALSASNIQLASEMAQQDASRLVQMQNVLDRFTPA